MGTHVQDIKERLNVADVISSYIKLEKAGTNYKARCPFHNEKTPSFYVSPDRGTYYCFGCGQKGDIFSFVETFEGLDFMGALRLLAERAGVKLDTRDYGKDSKKELYFKIVEDAARFYEERLADDATARAYILGRGLSEATLAAFRIGYAPGEWRALRDHLKQKGYKDQDVESVGLIKRSEKASQDPYYDTFRGRIMFPIGDSSGRIIGFTGRTLDEEQNPPKYLNSPETALFVKSKVLYGLDKAKQDIRKRDYTILVEGQMDLIMSHQAGFTNTVAASGTALSDAAGQDSALALLSRLSKNAIIAFDSDDAGVKATDRAVRLALKAGMDVKVAHTKGGKDPADVIKASKNDWAHIVKGAKPFIDFAIDVLEDRKLDEKTFRREIAGKVLPYIALVQNSVDQTSFVKRVADRSGIKEDALWEELKKASAGEARQKPAEVSQKEQNRLDVIEREILGILSSPKYLKSDEKRWEALKGVIGDERYAVLRALPPERIGEFELEVEVKYGDTMKPEEEFAELLGNLEEEILKQKLVSLTEDHHRKVRKKESDEEVMKEIDRVSKRIQKLKQIKNTSR